MKFTLQLQTFDEILGLEFSCFAQDVVIKVFYLSALYRIRASKSFTAALICSLVIFRSVMRTHFLNANNVVLQCVLRRTERR